LRLTVQGTNGNRDAANSQGFRLEPGDQVFVRPLPGFSPLRTIEINGEVVYPGSYTIESKAERISRAIRRAGGLSPDAYAQGFRLFRNGQAVGVNLPRALEKPGTAHDLVLEPGDRLEIPRYDPTVLVTGAVGFESRIRYERGLDVDDYLERAGGVRDDGDEKRVSVRYPNGELRTTRTVLGVRAYPDVQPGSTITVPVEKESNRRNLDEIFTRSLTILSTLATLIVAVNALK
jgi:polysaccharide biosynthesis/export protein